MTALILLLNEYDERALHALVTRRRLRIDRLMGLVTLFGDAWLTITVAIGLLLAATPQLRAAGAEATFSLVASHLCVQLLKRSIVRSRPRLPVGCQSLIAAPDRFSFPSGHAAASLSIALPLVAILPFPAAALVLSLALMVGLSRCYLGVHYPGDVLAGWFLAVSASLCF